jgi:hypothetical protein
MRVIATVAMLCTGIAVNASGPRNGVRLPVDKPGDCFIRNDTITVITQGRSLYLYTIVGDSLISKEKLDVAPNSEWDRCELARTPTSTVCLFQGTKYVHLYELLANDISRTTNTKIPIFCTRPYYLIPWKSSQVVIFSDYTKRFALNSHSLSEEYGPLSFCKMSEGVVSKKSPIETGKISSSNLQNVAVHDTIFAVWEQCEHNSFMTWVTDIKNSLVFSAYDGNSWSEPEMFYDITGRQISLLGMYELNNQLYCFWTQETTDGASHTISYMRTTDRRHWSAPVELTKCSGLVKSWLACNDAEHKLRLVISDTKRRCPSYSTFDGETLESQSDVELEDADPISLAVDKGKVYLFYCRQPKMAGGDKSGMITENYVSEKGDTVRVDIIKPDNKDEERANLELFVVPL